VSRTAPQTWFAVGCDADNSPALARLRRDLGPLADAYFYRACSFAKLYAATGNLENTWEDLAVFVRWPDSAEDLRQAFHGAGIVEGPHESLWHWYETNGWIIRARAADAAKHRALRAAKAGHAKAERLRRAKVRAGKAILDGRSVGRDTGTSPGTSADVTGTSPGRAFSDPKPDPKPRKGQSR
jgi:hypothetical protein